MKIGYARTSTRDQNLDLQINELKKAKCDNIYQEQLSGKNAERPELKKLLDFVRKGDTVVITKLDRLARSTSDLLSIAESLKKKNAGLEVLNINLDTNTATGKLMLTVLGGIAEFERELMLERQYDGIQAAKAEGKYKGRVPIDKSKVEEVLELVDSGKSITKACSEVGISRRAYYNHV